MAIGTGTILGITAGLGAATSLAKKLGLRQGAPGIPGAAGLAAGYADERNYASEVAAAAAMLPTIAQQKGSENLALAWGGAGNMPAGMSRQVAARSAQKRADADVVPARLKELQIRRQVSEEGVRARRREQMAEMVRTLRAQGVNTPEEIVRALAGLTGGDKVLMEEARNMASGGRLFVAGTAPGFAEDVGSFMFGTS